MKKAIIICGMLFSMVTFAHAQGGKMKRTPEERATQTTTQLTEKLALTAEQQSKVKAILLEQNTQQSKAWEEAKADRKEARTKMMEKSRENNSKINEVLNDEQKKTYAAYQQDRKEKMQNRTGRRVKN